MHDAELGLTIVFNGCIYNYKSLRAQLERDGYRFFSRSDTEVILKAYHAWGDRFVDRLIGMWAFAIHERTSGSVLLGRDRLGIKPLYFSEVPGGCGSRRRCPRSWPRATSTPRSTPSGCTTT